MGDQLQPLAGSLAWGPLARVPVPEGQHGSASQVGRHLGGRESKG